MFEKNRRFLPWAALLIASCGFADAPIQSTDPASSEAPPKDLFVVESVELPVVELEPAVFIDETAAIQPGVIPAPDAESEETISVRQAQSAQWDTVSEEAFLDLINDERRQRGLNALKGYWDLQDDARSHSVVMENGDHLHHNPNLSSVTVPGYWQSLGENVGVGPSVESLHRAFMNSEGHRRNILGDWTHIGIGVRRPDKMWVTVVFMRAAVDGLENTYGPFTDDDFSTHEAAIHKIWKAGVTYGCGGQKYCPERTVTRGEMAAFLTRALGLPATNANHFDDDNGKFYEASANAMFESGITVGCGGRNYCGDRGLKRGEMAVFLDRAFSYPSTGVDYFTDDDGRFYEQSANDMKSSGITYGCGGSNFCGERSLTRAEMAAFLARALGL